MSKERPILFSSSMVIAILAGRKTVTRRVITRSNSTVDGRGASADFWAQLDFSRATIDDGFANEGHSYLHVPSTDPKYDGAVHRIRCRIDAGTDLWVRETWRTGVSLDKHNTSQIEASARDAGYARGWGPVQYEADKRRVGWESIGDFGGEPGRIRQSIYMPRWASRIVRGVVSVRPERLDDIDNTDAEHEGVEVADRNDTHKRAFARLWDKINGKRPGCAWGDRPWVWRIEFAGTYVCKLGKRQCRTCHKNREAARRAEREVAR